MAVNAVRPATLRQLAQRAGLAAATAPSRAGSGWRHALHVRFVLAAMATCLAAWFMLWLMYGRQAESSVPVDPEARELLNAATQFATAWLADDRAKAEQFSEESDRATFGDWWFLRRAALGSGFGHVSNGEVMQADIEKRGVDWASVRIGFRLRGQPQLAYLDWRHSGTRWVLDLRDTSADKDAALVPAQPR